MLDWLFTAVRGADAGLAAILPPFVRLLLWGALAGAASMLIYRAVSPQARLKSLAERTSRARAALATYSGDFDGVGRLARESIWLGLAQVALALGPAVLASLPVLPLLGWVSADYAYAFPPAGAAVEVVASPAAAGLRLQGEEPSPGAVAGWVVTWPAPGSPALRLTDGGRELAVLPPPAPTGSLSRRHWWNTAFPEPAGYLPADGPLESLRIACPRRVVLARGPAWARTWELPFLGALFAVSLAIKRACRIS